MFQKPSQYKKVSQTDSEDDEVLLYSATPLSPNGEHFDDQTFGTGVYNRDLRLNLSSPAHLQAKTKAKLRERRNMIYSGLLCAALMVVLLGVAFTIVVYAQVYLPHNLNTTASTDTSDIDPLCVSPPLPLSGKINACKEKKPPFDLTSKAPPNVPRPMTTPVTPQSEPITIFTQHEKTTDLASPTVTTVKTTAAVSPTITTVKIAEQKTSQQSTTSPTSSASNGVETLTTSSLSLDYSSKEFEEVTTNRFLSDVTEPSELIDAIETESDLSDADTTLSSKLTNSQHASHSVDWTIDMFPAATELSLQMFDMNKDGILDVLTAKLSDECTCSLLGLDGLSGQTVWQTKVNFDVFSLRCIIDSNQDDVIDCIATGRFGGFIVVSGVDGSIIWTVDSDIAFPKYNFYFPLLIDDLDEDGVPDLINTHGGDSAYVPWEKNRSPGFLVVVSGRTGGKLIEPILMPDGRETYCSPVLFKMDSVDMILYGSGGETVPGSLWGVTLASIRTKVSKNMAEIRQYKSKTDDTFHPCFMDIEGLRPTFNETFFDNSSPQPVCPDPVMHSFVPNSYDLCLYEILHSPSKGIVLPPLILDVNADDSLDLLISTFDGHLYAYDGTNMANMLWETYNPNTESYSLPIPLFYNDDSIPDLLIRANLGEWATHYNSSTLFLVDGQSGDTPWSLESIYPVMHSGLSLAADTYGQDAMLFFTVGEKRNRVRRHGSTNQKPHDEMNAPPEPDDIWTSTPDDPFPNPDDELDSFLHYCDRTMEELSVSVYFLTREMIKEGEIKPIMTEKPFVFRGEVPANFSVDLKRQANNPNYQDTVYGEAPKDLDNNLPPGFDSNELPPGFDSNELPPGFNSNELPPGFQPPSDYIDYDPSDKRKVRCAHILLPITDVATPTIGDINADGKLELSYVVGWEGIPGSEDYFGGKTPRKIRLRTFTIEDRFVEVFGKGKLDFSNFLSPDKQPWTKYMGQTGDNVFLPKHKLRKN